MNKKKTEFVKKILLEFLQCFWMFFCGVWIFISELLKLVLKVGLPRMPDRIPSLFASQDEKKKYLKSQEEERMKHDAEMMKKFEQDREKEKKAAMAAHEAAMAKDMNRK